MFIIEPRPFGHPDVVDLVAGLQAEYMRIYGTPDETPVEDGEFDPPRGLFLVGLLDGKPAAAGGWRGVEGPVRTGEIKRMFVQPWARGQGLSRLMLAELEATLAGAGYERVVLMTGEPQQAAIALYESSGYEPGNAYGIYACAPDARFYAKVMETDPIEAQPVEDRAASRAMRA